MIPNLLFQTHIIQPNRGSFLENRIDNCYLFCYSLKMFTVNRIISQRNGSDSNSTHSSTIVAKLINISIPAILWSFDTICVSTSCE